jgi:hypothetical protein
VCVATRNRGGDECLAHADIVREECSAKLFERRFHAGDCRLLMGLQCDLAEAGARFSFGENHLGDASAYDCRDL